MWRLSKKTKLTQPLNSLSSSLDVNDPLENLRLNPRNNRSEKKSPIHSEDETNGRSRELWTVTWKHPLRKIEQRSRYFARIMSCLKQASPDFIYYATFVTKEISK